MVVMGRVRAPHGLKGWVTIQPFTQELDGLLDYPEWWLRGSDGWKLHRVEEAIVRGATMVARFEGITDRDVAAALKGREVAVPRSAMPEAGEGEFYWTDLIGLEVRNREAVSLGRVEKILETGANAVLVVKGEKEVLVPLIQDVLVNVDLGAGQLTVDWE
ncbi:MAG: ribosome maturation factor RimM [Betaproteobacteria bacterium]